MKIVRKFVIEEDRDYGNVGARPLWMGDDTNSLDGAGVAHDMLEHVLHDDGGVEAEFKALGRMLRVRAQGDYWRRIGNINPTHRHLGSDFIEIIQRVNNGVQTFRAPPPTRPTHHFVEEVVEELRQEMPDIEASYRYESDDPYVVSAEQFEWATNWMRIGYRDALRRYRDYDPYDLTTLFLDLMKKANKSISLGDEGMVMAVRVFLDSQRIDIDLDYPRQF